MIYTSKASAKINIGLRILSRRKDGYHNIETIFYPLRLFDILKVDIRRISLRSQTGVWERGSINVTTDSPELKDGSGNICYKAAVLFLKKFEVKGYRVKINIKKNIPIGAGLGGGSSDGATVLKILYEHFKSSITGMTRGVPTSSLRSSQISELSQKIGSDVAYFLEYGSKPAYATGRGERLKQLQEFKINYPILVVYPGIHISTKWAYNKLKVESSKLKVLNKVKTFSTNTTHSFQNDFEDIVFKKYPAIKKIKDKMYDCGAVFSSMSGSGSTVYGIFSGLTGLKNCRKYFEKKRYKVYEV